MTRQTYRKLPRQDPVEQMSNQDDEIEWVGPTRGNGRAGLRDPSIVARLSMQNHGRKKGTLLSMYLYVPLMKEARWLAGDQVLMGFDRRGYVKIKRVPSGGFVLSPVGKNAAERKANVGKAAITQVRFPFHSPIKARAFKIDDVLIDSDIIEFPVELDRAN